MLDFSLSKDQLELQELVQTLADPALNARIEERDRAQLFDRDLWYKAAELPLQGLGIAKEFGGMGLDAVSVCIGLEALGKSSKDNGLNFSLAAHLLACAIPIQEFGSNRQKEYFLPRMCNGQWIATNAITEDTSGSDVYNLSSSAEETPEGYVLKGEKTYCSNGPVADLALVYVNTNKKKGFFGGISCFILEAEKGHFSKSEAQDKLGLRTTMMGSISYDEVIVSSESLLGKRGSGAQIFGRSMIWERICLGALHLGTVDRMLVNACEFAKTRVSGGKPIGSYQAVSHELAQIKVELEAARFLLYRAAWELDNGKNQALFASISKYFSSEFYQSAMLRLKQIYGGFSFRGNNDIERGLRDSMGATLYSGTSEIQLNIISKYLGL